MNQHLDKQLWAKTKSKKVLGFYGESIKIIVDSYSKVTGIQISLEFIPGKDFANRKPIDAPEKNTNGYPWGNIGGDISLRMGLRKISEAISDNRLPENFTFIFDKGKIRILSVDKAVEWWRDNILNKKNA